MYYDHWIFTQAKNLFLYILCIMIIGFLHERKTCFCTYIYMSKWHFFSVEKPLGKWYHTFLHTCIYVQKCILLIENLLKKPCSAENSNHYQDAFWHIYICKKVWVHFPKGSSGLKFFTWVPQNRHQPQTL